MFKLPCLARTMTPESFPFTLTIHAKVVIAEREIPLEWVARILTNPQSLEADSEDLALDHALGRIPEHGDRVLRVIYNKTVTPWWIVTVYFDRTQKDKL